MSRLAKTYNPNDLFYDAEKRCFMKLKAVDEYINQNLIRVKRYWLRPCTRSGTWLEFECTCGKDHHSGRGSVLQRSGMDKLEKITEFNNPIGETNFKRSK